MTIIDFDGKQYYMHFAAGDQEPEAHLRAHASRVGDRVFLNVVSIGGDHGEPEWTYLEYNLPDSGLHFRAVNPSHFDDVRESGVQTRERLEQHLDDAAFFADALSCTKVTAQPAEVTSER